MPRSKSHTPPMAGIADQAETVTPPQETFPRSDTLDVEVLMWAREEGRCLPGLHGKVLEGLAWYSDVRYPERRGLVWPSQDTLAADLGLHRGTVNKVLTDLEAVKKLRSSPRTDIEGYHLQYQLAGVDTGWKAAKNGNSERQSIVAILSSRIDMLETEVAALKAGAQGEEMSPVVTVAAGAERLSAEATEVVVSSSSNPFNNYDSDNYDYDQEPNVILDDIWLEEETSDAPLGEESPTESRVGKVHRWVLDHSPHVMKTWKEGPEAAIPWYLRYYESSPPGTLPFLEQVEAHELTCKCDSMKGATACYHCGVVFTDKVRETKCRYGCGKLICMPCSAHPTDDTGLLRCPDPLTNEEIANREAVEGRNPNTQEIWRAVLMELQLQLPRSAFQTWLKQTEGVAHDEQRFVVEAPTTFAVAWLERRMYNAIQKTVEKVTQQPLEVHFQVKQERGRV